MKAISLVLFLQLFTASVFAETTATTLPVGTTATQFHELRMEKASQKKLRKPRKTKEDFIVSVLWISCLVLMSIALVATILGILLKLSMVVWMTWGMVLLSLGIAVFFALSAFALFIMGFSRGAC